MDASSAPLVGTGGRTRNNMVLNTPRCMQGEDLNQYT